MGEFKRTRGSGEEDEAMLWDGELTGDKADVLTTLAYDNTLLTEMVEVIERFGEGEGDITDGEVGEFKVTRGGELTGDKSGKPGDEDECGLPGELLSHVKSIVSVATVAGHTTGTKWFGNQVFVGGGRDATTLRPSACRCTLLHAG